MSMSTDCRHPTIGLGVLVDGSIDWLFFPLPTGTHEVPGLWRVAPEEGPTDWTWTPLSYMELNHIGEVGVLTAGTSAHVPIIGASLPETEQWRRLLSELQDPCPQPDPGDVIGLAYGRAMRMTLYTCRCGRIHIESTSAHSRDAVFQGWRCVVASGIAI